MESETSSNSVKFRMPYTSMFMAALKAHIPWDALLSMSPESLKMFLIALNEAKQTSSSGEQSSNNNVRKATQADIDMLV